MTGTSDDSMVPLIISAESLLSALQDIRQNNTQLQSGKDIFFLQNFKLLGRYKRVFLIRIMERKRISGFRRIFTVDVLLFLAPAVGFNFAGQS